MLGKRRRATVVRRREEVPPARATTIKPDLFRHYFESKFEPLENSSTDTPSLRESEERESLEEAASQDSEWDGLSSDDEPIQAVEVIEYSTEHSAEADTFRSAEFKSFVSSKIPRERKAVMLQKPASKDAEEDLAETLNLKHDLDLQRLLKESHLLEKAKSSMNPGPHRHKATDMRLQSLGSETSLFGQAKMPLAHRRGINAKAASRDTLRRKEAQENGIILEKAARASESFTKKRDRGVDVPSVGRFSNGTLKLSRQDIAHIQGPRSSARRSKRGRR